MDGDWTDASGKGNNGNRGGAATFSPDAAIGSNAGSFSGSQYHDYVNIQPSSSLNIPNQITIQAWVKVPSSVSSGAYLPILDGPSANFGWADPYSSWSLYIAPSGAVFSVSDNIATIPTHYRVVYSPTAFPKDVWVHLAATYDGTTLKLYENGSLKQSTQYATSQGLGNPASIHIGEFANWYWYFNGLIDELAVYNRALSAQEIDVPPVVKLLSPAAGFTKNSTSLLNYTVSNGPVTVKVDGNVVSKVSGNSLDALPDGAHTVRVEALSETGKLGVAEVTFTVDTIAPTVSIDQVTTPTHLTTQTVSGTREANSTVTVAVNTTAVAGLVTYPTPTTWSSTITQMVPGLNNITVTATDAAGNSLAAVSSIALSSAYLTSAMISSHTIDVSRAELTTISFTTTAPATVTLKIFHENQQGPTGTVVYQTSKNVVAGQDSFTWDGHYNVGANAGMAVSDDAYLFFLEAFDGFVTTSYSFAAPGTGSVTCSQSPDADPLSNQPMTITYTPTLASRVTLSISWGSQKFSILPSFPATPVSHSYVWDVRNPSGQPLDFGASSSCTVVSLPPENYIITTGDTPVISDLKTDPYAMSLSYGQFTRIKYTLLQASNVTIQLVSPSGATITLASNQLQSAGPQELDWYGIDLNDATGKKVLVSEEGDYMVTIKAVNPVTASSLTIRGNLTIRN
jgi:hypothetical protein